MGFFLIIFDYMRSVVVIFSMGDYKNKNNYIRNGEVNYNVHLI